MLIARHYVIAGRVQGVGFRYFVEGAAAREGVHGWVRNLPDGRVEAHIEGDADAVERVEAALRRRPSASSEDDLEVEDQRPNGRPNRITIR